MTGLGAGALSPAAIGSLIAVHRSTEPGARVASQALGLAPVLDRGMRLGEGAGALLARGVPRAATATHTSTASLDEGAGARW